MEESQGELWKECELGILQIEDLNRVERTEQKTLKKEKEHFFFFESNVFLFDNWTKSESYGTTNWSAFKAEIEPKKGNPKTILKLGKAGQPATSRRLRTTNRHDSRQRKRLDDMGQTVWRGRI
jgi:hypothetical protein